METILIHTLHFVTHFLSFCLQLAYYCSFFYNLVLKWCFVCILIKSETGRQIRNLRKNRRRKKYLQFALQQFFPELQTLKFRDTQDKREKGTKVEHAFLNLSIFHGHVAPAYRRITTPPHMPCTMGAAPFMKSSSFLRFLSELLRNSDLKKIFHGRIPPPLVP